MPNDICLYSPIFMDISFLVNDIEKCLIIDKIMHSYSIKYFILNIKVQYENEGIQVTTDTLC